MLHPTLLLLTGILLFSGSANAFQRDYNISLDSNLAGYFRYVNLAARAIYRNDFVAAASYYEEAFKRKSNPFFVDLKNAILVNGKCGLYAKNEPLLRILINDKQIDADRLLADLPPRVFDNSNLEFIRALQQAKASKKKKPNVLETEIRKLFAADQQILGYVNIYSDKECRDSANNANTLKFIDLYRKLGFPSEEKLGVYYDDESSWSEILFTLLTNLQQTDHRSELLSVFKVEFLNGRIHPSVYASLLDFANRNIRQQKQEYNFMNTTINVVDGKNYRPFVYYSDSLMRVVNTNRTSIGLDSFHIVQKQVICAKFCPDVPREKGIIEMAPYTRIDIMPSGFVRAAFEKEKQDMAKWEINTEKIVKECGCREKVY